MGSVVISIDAELAWGFRERGSPPHDWMAASRRSWLTLLELLDEYRIPATWAVVGHLLLRECDGVHPEHPAPPGWFDHERGPGRLPWDLRFGRELVAAVRNASVPHEVGSLTFSRVEMGDPSTTAELARAEVGASLDVAYREGIELTSFVFPGNDVGHRDVLAAYGFLCYRGGTPDDPAGSGLLGPARKLAGATVGEPPPLSRPTVDEYGLVDVPASMSLFGSSGFSRAIVEPILGDPVVKRARRGIDRAAQTDREAETGREADTDRVFHVWLRPNDLGDERDVDRVRSILDYLDRRRRETDLRVETMREVADRVLADAAVSEPELVR